MAQSNADEQQEREELGTVDADVEECAQNMLNACAGNFKGQVNEDRAKAHGQEQGRFHFLSNSKVNEQTTDDPHHDTTRCDV